MNKGGKFIFGKSQVMNDGSLRFPPEALREYDISIEEKVYFFMGSKSTGGFCITRKGLLELSKLGHILTETQDSGNASQNMATSSDAKAVSAHGWTFPKTGRLR